MNNILKDYDIKFYEYYEELRIGFIKILNEIVDNYAYKSPEVERIGKLKADIEYLKKKNEALLQELNLLENKGGSIHNKKPNMEHTIENESQLKKIERIIDKIERTETNDNSLNKKCNNVLLRWIHAKDFNQPLPYLSYKSISQKQLREFIEELYEAKALYDHGCKKQYQPRETLEQFMYNHLKYKYGLNNIVIEWAFGIIEAVKIFSPNDNDIALFGLVI